MGLIAARIAEMFSPERIVLFGSHAWGEPGPASDIDILVIMETGNALAVEARIGRDCRPQFLPMVKIACLEEIAFRKGYITTDQVREVADFHDENPYCLHLKRLLQEAAGSD